MYRVIAADDENMVRLAMNTMINWEVNGFQFCGAAADGVQALALIQEHQPDLVITDIRMPNMDGLELIGKLKEKEFQGEILILSNYDDFDLVRTGLRRGAYDYLLKVEISRESLLKKIKEIKVILDKEKRNRTAVPITGESKKIGQPAAKEWEGFLLRGENIDIADGKFQLRLYALHLWQHDLRKQGGVNEQAVKSLLTDIIRTNPKSFLLKPDIDTYVFCDIGEKMLSADIADKIQNQLGLYLNLGCHMIYTDILREREEVKKTYVDCMAALAAMFYEEESLVLKKPLIIDSWNETVKIWERGDEEKLIIMLLRGNEDMAKECLEQFLRKYKEERVDPEQAKNSFFHLLNGIYYMLIFREDSGWDMVPIMKQIKEASHFSQLRAGAYEFVRKCVSKKICKKEVAELKYYIDHHLSERLTLSFLKDQVNLSEKYMCTVFKQVTGKSIIEYINEKRMEKAGELLLTTDKRMKEISDAVGIPDQFYLSKLFKKHYGMTPTQYKNKNPYK